MIIQAETNLEKKIKIKFICKLMVHKKKKKKKGGEEDIDKNSKNGHEKV